MSEAEHDLRLAGLMLAAGRSQRMGTLKQTLPWPANLPSEIRPPATIVSCAYDSVAGVCHRMFVAVGRDAPVVIAALADRQFTRVDANSDDEMLESIRIGLEAVVAHESSLGETQRFDGVLLQPGDHPGAARSTIDALLRAFRRANRTVAVMPEYHGKGGHPVLVPRTIFDALIAHQGVGGLRQFWIDHTDSRVRLAVEDPTCVLDLNTPAAYRQAIEDVQASRRAGEEPGGAEL